MKPEQKKTTLQWIVSVVGLILCVIFGFMLVCNLTIILKGTINPGRPPSVLGITPMVVLSNSMSGNAEDHIEVGDLIFTGKADIEKLKVGDIISFMEGNIVVTHRIIEVRTSEDGAISFITQGDANNVEDAEPVTAENLVGICKGRIPKLGDFALFLQKPVGMMLFIGVPLLAFIIYDIIRRTKAAGRENKKTAAIEAELERLRTLAGENSKASDETKNGKDVSEN